MLLEKDSILQIQTTYYKRKRVLTLPTNTDRESASSRFACVAAALAGSSCTKKN